MKNKIKILSIAILSSFIFQGCSEQDHEKLKYASKAKLFENVMDLSTADTVHMKTILSDSPTFEGSIKKSIEFKDFANISTYVDSSVSFFIKVDDKIYQSQVIKKKAVEAINNILSTTELYGYDLYVSASSETTSVFYVLVLQIEYNGHKTDVNILFIMYKGKINTIRFY